ncbi:uncharacterized protein F4812DRAFT_271885 [Daldinia caldariorum]|uniref:uncharacterized protein n=1 Tax=Daldinia caldariorum TaxID=326644 RepID=UPI0020071EC3|nr:uncharacterized protein F4812DRAFT_271885 [Daldinia caldariorum]KAI1470603.1 hypothetical protein F4812DRAFT_271885 [Daldinia caldariorum]
MAPVTELLSLTLKPDLPAAEAAAILDTTAATLVAQPGCLRVRTARTHEDPHAVRVFVDWENVAAHRAFEKTEAYAPFKARVRDAVAAPPQRPYHVEFDPFPVSALQNGTTTTTANGTVSSKTPVAEVLHMWFPGDYTDEQRARAEASAREFVGKMEGFAEGLTGEWSIGWSVERDIEREGAPSSVLVGILGWVSVEAHMKARDHPEFAKNIPLLRDIEGLRGFDMKHVSTTTVEAGNK